MYKCIIVPHKNCIKESSRTFLKLKCSSCLSARFMDGWIDGWIDRYIEKLIKKRDIWKENIYRWQEKDRETDK